MTANRPDEFPRPPFERTEEGALRRVGIELELTGIDLGAVAHIVADVYGGTAQPVSDYEQVVRSPDLGEFAVELDFEYLKARGRTEAAGDEGLAASIEAFSEEALASIAWRIAPIEVVTPPLPLDRLAETERLVGALRAAGARGTRDSPINAFGLHLNPEMPALDGATMLAYTQSFLALHDWLLEREGVDPSRRITPFINAFPREYVALALAAHYAPDATRFADDYLEWNADRNRALDLLPLLAHLDADRVRRAVDDPRIKPRPALHYRLPDSEVDVEGWGIRDPWERWLVVERFAAAPAARAALCAAYLTHLDAGIATLLQPWWKQCDQLIEKLLR